MALDPESEEPEELEPEPDSPEPEEPESELDAEPEFEVLESSFADSAAALALLPLRVPKSVLWKPEPLK